VMVDNVRASDSKQMLYLDSEKIIKVGKRKFVRIKKSGANKE